VGNINNESIWLEDMPDFLDALIAGGVILSFLLKQKEENKMI